MVPNVSNFRRESICNGVLNVEGPSCYVGSGNVSIHAEDRTRLCVRAIYLRNCERRCRANAPGIPGSRRIGDVLNAGCNFPSPLHSVEKPTGWNSAETEDIIECQERLPIDLFIDDAGTCANYRSSCAKRIPGQADARRKV